MNYLAAAACIAGFFLKPALLVVSPLVVLLEADSRMDLACLASGEGLRFGLCLEDELAIMMLKK